MDQGSFPAGVYVQGAIVPGNVVAWASPQSIMDGGVLDATVFTQPSSGFSSVIPDGTRTYIIGNNALLATGALTMPPNPGDRQRVTITSKSGITLFSISPNTGQSLIGSLASLVLGGYATWQYRVSDATWYRVG